MKGTVVVFAKVPEEGRAKSRIAREAGRAAADRIYAALLRRTARLVEPFAHVVSYDGAGGPGSLAEIFPTAIRFLHQAEGDLGTRLREALTLVAGERPGPLCAVGSDCPDLTPADIDDAFRLVAGGEDVVIGPARDGGYTLIALRDPDCGVFSVAAWGTGALLDETLALIAKRKLRHTLLAEKRDIDRISDWEEWESRHGESEHRRGS